MKLSALRQATTEITVPVGDGQEIHFWVWTRRGTVADQRALTQGVNKALGALDDKRKQAGKLDRKRDDLLTPVQELADQIAAKQKQMDAEDADLAALRADVRALEEQREAKLEELAKPLKAIEEQVQTLIEGGQGDVLKALAVKLEYFVQKTDLTDDEDTPLPSSMEFYVANFDADLLEKSVAAVDGVLSGPLAMSSPAPS